METNVIAKHGRDREVFARGLLANLDKVEAAFIAQDWEAISCVHEFVTQTFPAYTRSSWFKHDPSTWKFLGKQITEYYIRGYHHFNLDAVNAEFDVQRGLDRIGPPLPVINAVDIDSRSWTPGESEHHFYRLLLNRHVALHMATEKRWNDLLEYALRLRKKIDPRLALSNPSLYRNLRTSQAEAIFEGETFNVGVLRQLASKRSWWKIPIRRVLVKVHLYLGRLLRDF